MRSRRLRVAYKRGDTWPPLMDRITDRNGPVNLSTATQLRFLMRSVNETGASKVVGTAVAGNAEFTAVDGGIQYNWGVNDLDTVGTYVGEWEITFPGSQVGTAPNEEGEYLEIIVSQDLG